MLALDEQNRTVLGEQPHVFAALIALLRPRQLAPSAVEIRRSAEAAAEGAGLQLALLPPNPPAAAAVTSGGAGALVEDTNWIDEDTQRSACAALGNLVFKNHPNQGRLGEGGGVETLVALCRSSPDLDVLENASGAIANCASRHEGNAARIGACGGVEVLLGLIASEAAAERLDGVGERIAANSAEASHARGETVGA